MIIAQKPVQSLAALHSAHRSDDPSPEETAGRCPSPGDSARHGNGRRIRSAPPATNARRTGSPSTGTPPSPPRRSALRRYSGSGCVAVARAAEPHLTQRRPGNDRVNLVSRSCRRYRQSLGAPQSSAVAFRAICFIHASSGWTVIPALSTRRLSRWCPASGPLIQI